MPLEVATLTDGISAQANDLLPASRNGQPVRLTPGQLRAGHTVTGGKLVLFGDSLFQQGIEAGVTGTNGWQTTAQQRSPINWLQYLLGSPFDHTFAYAGTATPTPGHNAGVAGDETYEMIARFDANITPQKPDILFIIGGTNDIAQNKTKPTIIANLKELIDRSLSIGCKQVVLLSIPPRIAGGWSGPQESIRTGVNAAMKTYMQSFGERTKFIDQDPVLLIGGTGSAADPTLLQSDGIHYSPYGAYKVASQLLVPMWQAYSGQPRILRGIPEAYNVTTVPYGNLLANPGYTGTGGSKGAGITGTTPDNWHAARDIGSTVTGVAAITSSADWNGDTANFIQMTYTANGAGAAGELLAVRPTATLTTGVAATNYYIAELEVIISGATGVNPLESVFARLTDLQGDDTLVSAFGSKVSSGDVWPTGSEFNGTRLLLRTPPLLCDGATGLTLSFFTRVDGTKTGTITIQWGTPVVKRVLPPTWTL